MQWLTSWRVCHSVPGGCGHLNLEISVKYWAIRKATALSPREMGQFEVISLELLSKNASRFALSTTTMIMVVQPIIIIFQNRGQIFMGTWWVRLITVIIFPRL